MTSSRRKVVLLSSSFFPVKGGLQKYMLDLALALNAYYDVEVVCGTDFMEDLPPKEYEVQGVKVTRYKTFKFKGLVFLKNPFHLLGLWKKLRQADIIHHNDVKFVPVLPLFTGRKVYLSSHGYIFHSERNDGFKGVYMKAIATISGAYNTIIDVSRNDQIISDKFNLKNTLLIQEGINYNDFQGMNKAEEKDRMLYFGRVCENKGLHNLLRCFNSNSKYSVNIVGNAEKAYKTRLEKIVKEQEIDSIIELKGSLEWIELSSEISKAEFILLPSTFEGFGITLIEALASRTKVIASDIQAYRDILTYLGLTDLLFDFTKGEGLDEKVDQVRKLEIDFDALSEKLKHYHIDTMTKEVVNLYEKS